jgi:UDP-N-acetylmuramyl pentapeptide phosphotransferase/UDP-N-acetylglucosamine-1-phosphate transferase
MMALHLPMNPYRGLFAGGALLVLIGILDDHRDLSSRLRMIGQLIAAFLLIVWGGLSLTLWGNLFFLGPIDVGLWAIPVTLLIVVGFINALNMLDGQDGLAGGVAWVQLVMLLVAFYELNALSMVAVISVALSAVTAFLYFNLRLPWRNKASVFLGDTGSTFLAFIIIWFAIAWSQFDPLRVRPVAAVWLVAYPIFDLIQVVVYRLSQKKSPLEAGREHMHHILLSMGLAPMLVNIIIWSVALFFGVFGLLANAWQWPSFWIFITWLMMLLFYVLGCQFFLTHHRRDAS